MSSTTATLQPSRPHVTPRALSAQTQRQSSRSSIPGRDCARSASHPYPRRSREIRKESVARHVDAAAEIPSIAGEQTRTDEQGGMEQRPTKPVMKFDDFELMQTLGTGTFARVWLCRFKARKADEDNRVYALKVLRKVDVVKLKQVEHVRNERTVLAAVAGHPFIAQLLTTFSDPHSLYMLMEYTPGGELFSYLRRARRFPPSTVQFYAAEITLILGYLHDVQHVAYRDLKPENILLDADGHLKLVDFGFAKYLPPGTALSTSAPPTQPNGGPLQSHSQPQSPPVLAAYSQAQPQPDATAIPPPTPSVTYTLCGTPEYLAPEVIRNTGHTTAVDWWALGILVYEMLIGQPPFWDQNPMRIYEQIVQGHIRFPVSHGGGSSSLNYSSNHNTSTQHRSSLHIPRAAREFILALCKTDPSMRLGHILGGSKRVMAHHFFDGVNWDDLYYKRKRGPIVPRVEWAGDAGNFDEYPDPTTAEGESEGGRGHYTPQMKEQWDSFFEDF